MVSGDRIRISGDRGKTVEIRRLEESDTAMYSAMIHTAGGLEITRHWLVVRGRYLTFSSPEPTILLACGREREGSLACSNTGSPRFTDFPSNLTNLIGWECEMNTLRMLRKSGPARALDPNHRPEGSWALGTRMGANVLWRLFLTIFRRFPTTFRRFLKLFQRPDERSRTFSEDFQRLLKISEDFQWIPTNLSTILETKLDISEIIDILVKICKMHHSSPGCSFVWILQVVYFPVTVKHSCL